MALLSNLICLSLKEKTLLLRPPMGVSKNGLYIKAVLIAGDGELIVGYTAFHGRSLTPWESILSPSTWWSPDQGGL